MSLRQTFASAEHDSLWKVWFRVSNGGGLKPSLICSNSLTVECVFDSNESNVHQLWSWRVAVKMILTKQLKHQSLFLWQNQEISIPCGFDDKTGNSYAKSIKLLVFWKQISANEKLETLFASKQPAPCCCFRGIIFVSPKKILLNVTKSKFLPRKRLDENSNNYATWFRKQSQRRKMKSRRSSPHPRALTTAVMMMIMFDKKCQNKFFIPADYGLSQRLLRSCEKAMKKLVTKMSFSRFENCRESSSVRGANWVVRYNAKRN